MAGRVAPAVRRGAEVQGQGRRRARHIFEFRSHQTNTLGTCKHIEFLLGKLRRKRGGKAALAAGYRPAFSEVYLRYGARRQIVFQAGTQCPESLKKLAAKYFRGDGVLRPQAVRRFHRFLEKAGGDAGGHEVRCYDDALAFISRMRDSEELAGRIERAFPDGAGGPAWKALLKVPLYPYQRQGALFAARAGRCLIADDMGLGKTIQAIAAAEILARHADIRRVLVICPTSLKHQWQLEIARFTGRSAVVVEGLIAARERCYAADAFFKIVNYDVVHRDLAAIQRGGYDLIVLDEAQRIKNWKTRAAKAVKHLSSDYAFVLTGTPLENRLEELHSIVEFVDRHRLGPMFRFLATHQHVNESGKVVGYQRLDEISRTLEPILVRRTKQAVLKDLPERLDKRFFVPMTAQQLRHHEENREIVAQFVAKWRRYGYLSEIDQKRLTCALQNMRMSCDSTYLLDKKTDPRSQGRRVAVAAGGGAGGAGHQGRDIQPVAGHARADRTPAETPQAGARDVSRRRTRAVAQKAGGAVPRRPGLPVVFVHRRRRRGAEPAASQRGGQHGSSVEPGGSGIADRARAQARPAPAVTPQAM